MAVGFTVAIPTHDRRETAVLATLSALRQTRPPNQVLVLCDGCSDGTADSIRALGDERAVALELPKGDGYGYAHRNRALDLATGDVVLWLGDDDLLLPDHLERIGRIWDRGDVDLVTSYAVLVQPDDRLYWVGGDWSVPEARARMERQNTNVMASVSVDAALARDVGGWNASLPCRGDWDLWLRMLAAGARPAATGVASVLHFRGTERVQSWPDRVAQNRRWLERISDAETFSDIRVDLERVRARREARFVDRIEALESERDAILGSRWWRAGRGLGRITPRFARRARSGDPDAATRDR